MDPLIVHFGLIKMPFGRDIPVDDLFKHRSHVEATARISYLISEGSIGVITGECGSGKTVSLRSSISSLSSSNYTIIYISNPSIGTRGLYVEIVQALNEVPKFHKFSLISQVNTLFMKEEKEMGKSVVLVVDESHLLDGSQLEELRLLTNCEMDSKSMFSLILLGQPSLKQKLKLSTFKALDQRITMRYAMVAMTRDETKGYISHHLKVSGKLDPLFTNEAIDLIHEAGRGLPRLINNLSRSALLAAYSENSLLVDEKATKQAIVEEEGVN